MHSNKDLGAKIASGSQDCDAMVIVPCSMKTLAGVAHGLSRNLVERAADVMLKERRPLIIVPRETPMSLPQLRNMVLCAEAGAMIMPAMPAFYQMPKTLDDLADFMAGKILSALGFKHELYPTVEGMTHARPDKTPSRIAGMFDAIAPRYDLLNRVLSAGLDRRWRDRAVDALELAQGARVLDLCTGTADLAIATVRRVPGATVVGVDFAGAMLRLGLSKVRDARSRSLDSARPRRCDPHSCRPVRRATRRRSRSASGTWRSPSARWLKSRASCGRMAGLRSSSSDSLQIPGIRSLYSWYFRFVLPAVGRLVSKHNSAYSYLPASVGHVSAAQPNSRE